MKKLLLIALFAASFAAHAQAQTRVNQANVTQDKNGNYTQISKKDTTGKTSAKQTGKLFTDAKGVQFPVMESKNGKLFVIKASAKTGKNYNYYLKTTGAGQ